MDQNDQNGATIRQEKKIKKSGNERETAREQKGGTREKRESGRRKGL